MKTIYAISGSAGEDSSNKRFLASIAHTFAGRANWKLDDHLLDLPLYRPGLDQNPLPKTAVSWRQSIVEGDGVIICTPEYLHNIPAVLKNGLEWLKSSGELMEKPVLPITFTPHEPRGEHAMPSLCNSLKALKARVVVELPLYRSDFKRDDDHYVIEGTHREMIATGLELLGV